MKIPEYLILVKSFESLRGNFIWSWVGEHAPSVWCFWESIMAIFKEIECFPSDQGKQSKRDWILYPISANIRKSTINSPFWITLPAIPKTYWLVRNGMIITHSEMSRSISWIFLFFISFSSLLIASLLYQWKSQFYKNRKCEISIRKNIKYAIFQNVVVSVLYYPCKTFEANPRSQKWFTSKIIEGV